MVLCPFWRIRIGLKSKSLPSRFHEFFLTLFPPDKDTFFIIVIVYHVTKTGGNRVKHYKMDHHIRKKQTNKIYPSPRLKFYVTATIFLLSSKKDHEIRFPPSFFLVNRLYIFALYVYEWIWETLAGLKKKIPEHTYLENQILSIMK